MKLPPRFILDYYFNGSVKPLIVDALASGKGVRHSTQDVIGAGPRTVAGVLESDGLEPIIMPVEVFLDPRTSIADYGLLLISGMSSDFSAVQRVVRRWRKSNRGMVIIGGPVTSEPERVLLRAGCDIAVIGEGELSLVELLERGLRDGERPDNLDEVRGIGYRQKKRIVVNPLRPVQPTSVFTDFLPSTDTIVGYRLFKSARVYVEAVRGCSNFHRARIGEFGEKYELFALIAKITLKIRAA